MKRTSWVLVTIFLLFAACIGWWSLDIGTSAMVASARTGAEVKGTNGFWTRNPIQQYHLGLLVSILSTLGLAFIAARGALGDLTSSEEEKILSRAAD